jgi:hypothetical protein
MLYCKKGKIVLYLTLINKQKLIDVYSIDYLINTSVK